jgi:hypothetical protein
LFLTDGSSYELIQFISTPNFSTDLTIYVKGNPFNGVSSTIENFIIRPNNTIVNEVFNLELDEIEEALLSKSVDLAVHSHKDLETTPPEGLVIASVPIRANVEDILLINKEMCTRMLEER